MKSTAIKPSSSTCFNQKLFNPRNNPYQKAISYFSISIFGAKPQKRAICVSCKLPINNNNNEYKNKNPLKKNSNHSIPLNPFSLLAPILQTIKSLTSKASNFKWVFCNYKDPSIDDIIGLYNDKKTEFLHNGGLGMALLTVQTSARDRFNPFVATLAANPTFISGLLAWFLAQSTKVLLNFFVERKWDLRYFCSSGGMPSSHSALCTAMTTSVALCHGVADSLFPVCLGFSLIVMYDATGVRRHAGMQAQVLNKIIEDLFQGHPISERKLKELLGHTPSQVIAGALLGIAVACFCCQACLISI